MPKTRYSLRDSQPRSSLRHKPYLFNKQDHLQLFGEEYSKDRLDKQYGSDLSAVQNLDNLGSSARTPFKPVMSWSRADKYVYMRPGAVRIPVTEALQLYGPSYYLADKDQRAMRNKHGFYRRIYTRFTGQGTYRRRRIRKLRSGRLRRRPKRRRPYNMGGGGLYTGRGGFFGNLWKNTLGKKSFRTGLLDAAAAAGSAVKPQFASQIGMARDLARATGIGSYGVGGKEKANVLINNGASRAPGVPTFTQESDTGSVTVSYRMFVKDIFAPGTSGVSGSAKGFSVEALDLNPGLEATFPWLSQVAANYEQYCMHQLIFTFVSSVSSFETDTGVTGDILMLHQANEEDRVPQEAWMMKNTHGVVSGQVIDNLLCGVECDPAKTAGDDIKFVRYEGIDETKDKSKYDKGRLVLATANCPDQLAGNKIGELWCSYTVTLSIPKVVTATAAAVRQDVFVHKDDINTRPLCALDETTVDCHLWGTDESLVYKHVANSIGVKVARETSLASTTYPWSSGQVSGSYMLCSDAASPGDQKHAVTSITFPAGTSGDFEIDVNIMTSHSISEPQSNTFPIGKAIWGAKGQVGAIDDIPTGFLEDNTVFSAGNSAIDHGAMSAMSSSFYRKRVTSGGVTTYYLGLKFKLHCRVKSNAGGEDNIVYLVTQIRRHADDDTPASIKIHQACIRVSEYNALDDGSMEKSFVNDNGLKLDVKSSKSPSAPF